MTNISNTPSSVILPLKDLNLIDDFLFQEATSNPIHAEIIAKAIIRRTLGIKLDNIIVEVEKPINNHQKNRRGIRMDICVTEFDSTHNATIPTRLFKIEPNKYKESNLPKRSRYSTSLLDAKLLPTNTSPSMLPTIYSIWILPYDPFGEDRMVYTVKNTVVENHKIDYNDGITKIFLYISGNSGGSTELRNLLRFFANSTADYAVDEELSKMQEIIDHIKHDERAGDRYMDYSTYVTYEELVERMKEDAYINAYESGYDSGYNSGYSQAIQSCIHTLKAISSEREKVKEALITHYHLSVADADKYLAQYW